MWDPKRMKMSDKTPITQLQELSIAYSSVPQYELIHDGSANPEPSFKYRVEVVIKGNEICGIGFGRTKKEAKHDAAKVAIEVLAELGIRPASSSPTEPVCQPARYVNWNSIGTLQQMCTDLKMPNPEYELTQDVGPPHAREFTIKCSVASLTKYATAATKKAAKQLAALSMIELFKSLNHYPMSGNEIVAQNSGMEDVEMPLSSDKDKTMILTTRIAEYDSPFRAYDRELCEQAKEILQQPGDYEELFKKAMDTLNIDFSESESSCGSLDKNLYAITLKTEPSFVFSDYSIPAVYETAAMRLSILL